MAGSCDRITVGRSAVPFVTFNNYKNYREEKERGAEAPQKHLPVQVDRNSIQRQIILPFLPRHFKEQHASSVAHGSPRGHELQVPAEVLTVWWEYACGAPLGWLMRYRSIPLVKATGSNVPEPPSATCCAILGSFGIASGGDAITTDVNVTATMPTNAILDHLTMRPPHVATGRIDLGGATVGLSVFRRVSSDNY